MALTCIDKIISIEKGVRIRAEKTVRPDEEHFQDHFGGFPVLPGVLMLEGLCQTAACLVRDLDDFARSQVFLSSCSQAKFSKLVQPPAVVAFEAELAAREGDEFEFKGKVTQDGNPVAAARFKMRAARVGDQDMRFGHLEEPLQAKHRKLFAGLRSH